MWHASRRSRLHRGRSSRMHRTQQNENRRSYLQVSNVHSTCAPTQVSISLQRNAGEM